CVHCGFQQELLLDGARQKLLFQSGSESLQGAVLFQASSLEQERLGAQAMFECAAATPVLAIPSLWPPRLPAVLSAAFCPEGTSLIGVLGRQLLKGRRLGLRHVRLLLALPVGLLYFVGHRCHSRRHLLRAAIGRILLTIPRLRATITRQRA